MGEWHRVRDVKTKRDLTADLVLPTATMAFRINKKERATAQKAPSYLAVPGPAVPHHNKKLKPAAN
jgi:hypothetical protein